MDKKSFFAIFILFVVFLIVSGASCPIKRKANPNDAEQNLKTGTHIFEGSDGLVVSFVKDVPPNRVYSGEPLTIAFDVYNRGATGVGGESGNSAYLYLSGADPNIVQFDISSFPKVLDVPGKNEVLGVGGYSTVSFETSSNVDLTGGMDSYKPKFVGTVCYSYETSASPVVCLDPSPFGTFAGEKACKVLDVSLAGGQGAPIAVTKVEQMPMKGSTQLKIYVRNVGKGKVIRSDKLSTCTQVGTQDYDKINKLDGYYVGVGSSGALNMDTLSERSPSSDVGFSSGMSCSPDSLRLVNNEAIIICKYNFDDVSNQAFTSPITIKLFYSYVESTTPREVEILNVGPTTQ